MFDIAVIGIGMIGSAALRYLSQPTTQLKVIGIGPAEPADWQTHNGAFASHYDQARITRITDPDLTWAMLAQRAISSYAAIKQASDIPFHVPAGHLRLTPYARGQDHPFSVAEEIGRTLGAPLEHLNRTELATRFPYLNIPAAAEGLYELGGAGWINPRALVEAQLTIATAQGATIVRDEVTRFGRADGSFTLHTTSGEIIQATRLLISAHGYSRSLLTASLGRTLDLVSLAHTTVYAELSAQDTERLGDMPSVIWQHDNHPVLPSVYLTPPTTYPDGRSHLKIGGPLHEHPVLQTPAEMLAWFQSPGNPVEIAALQEALLEIVADLAVQRWSSKPCMNSYTVHDYPYIDQVEDGVFVCTGGCGSAAKSSDEIGRIGALLVQHGMWAYDLPAETFRAVTAPS